VGRISPKQALCIFEYVYFARPDSEFEGQIIHEVRQRMGRKLAEESYVEADFVMGVPDSAVPAAIGFSQVSGIPFNEGLTKNRYIGRTFIQPTNDMRRERVRLKYNPLPSNLAGKRVILVDDSIVRGNTIGPIINLLREAGAREVHVRVSSPPVRHPCFMGIDMATYSQLIGHRLEIEEIRRKIGADSLAYLSLPGMEAAVREGVAAGQTTGHCNACFSGDYPLEVPQWLFQEDRNKYEFEKMWGARNGFCRTENVPIQPSDLMGLRHFALEKRIDLTVVGPEAPLAEGVVDLFQRDGLPIFGPTHQAAQLEASKAFAKAFMVEQHIPTAAYATFTDYHEAMAYLATVDAPEGLVVKASGLAAGKGVIICDDVAVAQEAVHAMMQDRAFGTAGDAVRHRRAAERSLNCRCSLFAMGTRPCPCSPPATTSGFSTTTKAPTRAAWGRLRLCPMWIWPSSKRCGRRCCNPRWMACCAGARPSWASCMRGLCSPRNGLRVLEFNCRFGDPETQVLAPPAGERFGDLDDGLH
jgi:adenine/guanine phosphoribosyltransferase-like PRPP-binding protein